MLSLFQPNVGVSHSPLAGCAAQCRNRLSSSQRNQVDYALKLRDKPVLFLEAKALDDPLEVKSITQVVAYAANAGVDWCILTNGITYKIYRSSEKAKAPQKLLFEVSIDPKESEDMPVRQIAEQFARFSRDSMEKGVLDKIGDQFFTTEKVRKALDKLFDNPPGNLVKIIRSFLGDESIKPKQIKAALKRIHATWDPSSQVELASRQPNSKRVKKSQKKQARDKRYSESHHLTGKPREVVELFRTVDKFCRELDPSTVQKDYLAKYINYKRDKAIFCAVHVQQSGLRIWLKLDYSDLDNPPDYVRDVSNIGHWGTGNVELAINTLEKLETCKQLITLSFEKNT